MSYRCYIYILTLTIVALLVFAGAGVRERTPDELRAVASWLADGAESLEALVVSRARAEEDAALAYAEDGTTAAAAAEGAISAIADDFPPPPEVASEPATRATMAALPLPPRGSYIFETPRDPILTPAPGEEALARAAIRTVAAFAIPGWIASPQAKTGRRARLAGEDLEAELRCLALNIYWEARSESALGRLAVAAVTLNRVAHRDFPDTICDVVRQGEELGLHRCQFSWVCDRRSNEPNHDTAWREAEHVAFSALFLSLPDPTRGALWYHADYVSPPWAGSMTEAMRIGRHVFYRGPVRTVEAPARGATG